MMTIGGTGSLPQQIVTRQSSGVSQKPPLQKASSVKNVEKAKATPAPGKFKKAKSVSNLAREIGGSQSLISDRNLLSKNTRAQMIKKLGKARQNLQQNTSSRAVVDAQETMTTEATKAKRPWYEKAWSKISGVFMGGIRREEKALATIQKAETLTLGQEIGSDQQVSAKKFLKTSISRLNEWAHGEGNVQRAGNVKLLTGLGANAVNILSNSGAADGLEVATSAVKGVVSGAQILVEGYELKQNVRKLSEALTRKETAEIITCENPIKKIEASMVKIEAELKSAMATQKKPGLWSRMFSNNEEREAKVSLLRAKLLQLPQLKTDIQTNGIKPEAKAIAQQVVDRAGTRFKMARIAKNVLGIAAGAIGIAVAVGALATPVGWVAAGVSLAATLGTVGVNLYVKSKRNGLQKELSKKQTSLNDKIQESTAKLKMLEAYQGNFEKSAPKLEQMLFDKGQIANMSELKQGISDLKEEISSLKQQQYNNTLELLKVSPGAAATEIIAGFEKGNKQMSFLMTNVLGVTESEANLLLKGGETGREALKELLQTGMPLQPKD